MFNRTLSTGSTGTTSTKEAAIMAAMDSGKNHYYDTSDKGAGTRPQRVYARGHLVVGYPSPQD